MASSSEAITSSLQLLDKAKQSYLADEAGSTTAVLDAARAILAAGGQAQNESTIVSTSSDEKPSDFLQRVMWAEVCDKTALSVSFGDPTIEVIFFNQLTTNVVRSIATSSCRCPNRTVPKAP